MVLPTRGPNEQRVLILAPAGRDSSATRSILSRAGIETMICTRVASLCRELEADAGLLLLEEEALTPPETDVLADALGRQPSWSDLPSLVLTGPGPDSDTLTAAVGKLGNVTLLERPVRVTNLVSAVRSALRARQRQYELRERLGLQTLLAAIVESADVAMVGKNTEGIILTWNEAAERLFGYTAAEAVGQSVTMLIPPERVDEEREILSRIVRGERVSHLETVRITKDRRRFHASLTISPIRDAAGRIIGASKVARDITEQKRFEREMREADRRKDEFLATLSHELRNPLAPIRNSLALLEPASRLDPTVDRVRGILERQVGHMVRLVDDLLEVSRITRGRIELRCERLELAQAIRTALETSEPLIQRAGVSIALELPAQPLFVEADPVRLTQIVSNLVNNAAIFSDHAGEVRLTARREDGQAVISVRDHGVGIPADRLERVFDVFSQVPNVSPGSQSGVGVGLSLVRSLVQLHGGSVSAASEGAGKGSTFTIRLPLVQPSARPVRQKPGNGAKDLSLRILVVDDNRDAAESMGLVLARAGADVEVANDGTSALAHLDRFHPAIILLDIGMPGLDGYEVARQIRARQATRDVMLVALTGWGQAEDRRRSFEAGFDHHLTKPAGIDELRALLPAVSHRA